MKSRITMPRVLFIAPILVAALGLAACDDYNQEQAVEPEGTEERVEPQTGAVPPGAVQEPEAQRPATPAE